MSLIPKAENFNEKWDKLQKTMEKLISLENVSRKLWNDHFSDIYFLCVANPQPFTERLYTETKKFLHNHVKMLSAKLLESSCNDIVSNYYIAWVKYSVGVRHLHSLFLYLNMQYVKLRRDSYVQTIQEVSNNDLECVVIGELGLTMWKTHVIAVVKDTLIDSLFKGIFSFKIHCPVSGSKQVHRGSVESFVLVEDYKKKDRLKLYQDICEEPYLERCGIFYEIKSRNLWQECDTNQYLKLVWQLFEEEKQCCTEFLHCSTLKKVEALFVKYMVADHLALLHEECRSMVQQEQFSNLRMMYVLLRLVSNEVKVLASELLEHIKAKGEEVITELTGEDNDIQFIDNCLALHEKYSSIIRNFFDNDQTLLSALDQACTFLVNKRQTSNTCRSPEILAKYCDVLLKKSRKGLSDAELEEKLVKSMIIFRYIYDKDVFRKWYSRMLAKRLIHKLSQSLDAEETMINKLKQACGYEFTNNLHRMFTDVKVSSDLHCKFSEFLAKENVDLGLSLFIYVFQAASWPLSQIPLTPVSLPMQLEKSVHTFDKFYHHHFSSRKLTFLHNLCQVEVKLNYLKKCYMVSMQMFQMVILLQFENLNVLRYSELQEATQLTDEQFTKFMKSLVDSKLVICTDQAPSASSLFHLNLKYVNKRTKFRIAVVAQRESAQEVELTLASVEKDRTLYLHAAIVRVMKSRKRLDHGALVCEILSMCKEKFIPEVGTIKKAIEYLIERQYIEGFEHLLANLGLGQLAFDKNHSVALHRVNGTFRDVHDSLKLHNHSHSRDRRHAMPEYEPELKKLMQEHEENNTNSRASPRACLTPQDMLVMYGLQPHHGAVISPLTFLHMCPVIIYELDQKACYVSVADGGAELLEIQSPAGNWKWLYAAISVLVVSVTGLAGMLLVPLVHSAFYQHILSFLVALAVGTLCGDALLHLLPHAILSSSEDHAGTVLQGAAAFGAACFFFTMETVLSSRGQDKQAEENYIDGSRNIQDGSRDSVEMGAMLQRNEPSKKHHHQHQHDGLSSVVHMVVMGDGLHNLTDGLAIGAAFSGDVVAGVATTVAVFCHELPHELGDFAVLIKSGVSMRRAVMYNIFSSILSFIGMAFGLWLGVFESVGNWISSFTAGTFLYIALANLIPEMKSSSGNLPQLIGALLQVSGIVTGGTIMMVIALFEDSILTMFGS